MTRALWLDMDGVLADFETLATEVLGMGPVAFEAAFGEDALWDRIYRREHFFADLALLPDARALWDGVMALGYRPAILTGTPKGLWAEADKIRWARRHFPETRVQTCLARHKYVYCVPGAVLIDDREKYARRWRDAGGVFIVHRSAAESLAQLRALSPPGEF